MLTGKTIVLGVTGSIAAYKAVDIASKLFQAGAMVRVVMTKSATELVKPITFQAITRNPVVTEMFAETADATISHVSLGETADLVVIAPATANTIARLAYGIADDLLSCTVLATRAPVMIAPAMHTAMWENPATQENVIRLRARGFIIVEPESGHLASGGVGPGRLASVDKILGMIRQALGARTGDMVGKKVVVTAGGTREEIDPVRYVGNHSSGKMGYALAEAARDRGAEVTLVTAPTAIAEPVGVQIVKVTSAVEMKDAVDKAMPGASALIMAAAVADYQPRTRAEQKIKKDSDSLTLELVKTPDILEETRGEFIRVGFAAESENLLENASRKLVDKKLDLIVANDITSTDSGFGADTNRVTLVERGSRVEELPLLTKREVADKILDRVVGLIQSPTRRMEIKAVTCQEQSDYDDEREKAIDENRIFLAIKPRRKYAEVIYDIFTVDPMICSQLNAEGFEALHNLYDRYLAGVKGTDAKKFKSGVEVSYGPQTGSLLVLARDAEGFCEQLGQLLKNPRYWESLG
jgi:phosphopantothenoylcysteine decarboxylase/phosphopantothenate--cysteine ligase